MCLKIYNLLSFSKMFVQLANLYFGFIFGVLMYILLLQMMRNGNLYHHGNIYETLPVVVMVTHLSYITNICGCMEEVQISQLNKISGVIVLVIIKCNVNHIHVFFFPWMSDKCSELLLSFKI
jgi:hypothetical protein